jgi:hypothetical protein
MRNVLVLGISSLLLVQTAAALNYQQFAQCLGAQGQGSVCQLDAGNYVVTYTLEIARSNITISGTTLNSTRQTTLQRAAGFSGSLLMDQGPGKILNSITIRDLTIDGNRAHNEMAYNLYSPEAGFFAIKGLVVLNCAFLNSPNIGLALYAGGTSDVVVDSSLFSHPVIYGLWSDALGNNGNITYLQCPTKKFVDNVTVENSTFENAGEPAILGEMTHVQILNSTFTNNHSYSIPFDDDGGQIDLTVCTENAVISNNTFQNGSASPNGHVADGIELHGTNIAMINNVIKNNSGDGINMDGVQNIFIANWDASTGSFGNSRAGIAIAHSSSTFRLTEHIIIESANSTGNDSWGIWSDTSETTPDEPVNHLVVSDSCLSRNKLGPTYFVDLGSDVTLKNNKSTGCKIQ